MKRILLPSQGCSVVIELEAAVLSLKTVDRDEGICVVSEIATVDLDEVISVDATGVSSVVRSVVASGAADVDIYDVISGVETVLASAEETDGEAASVLAFVVASVVSSVVAP